MSYVDVASGKTRLPVLGAGVYWNPTAVSSLYRKQYERLGTKGDIILLRIVISVM